MIYFLQIGERKSTTAATLPLPNGLTEWVLPVMLEKPQVAALAQEYGLPGLLATRQPQPLLPAPYPEPYYGNARAYRRVHLELLAGHAGIDELLFDQGGYGLLATTPDLVVLRPEHAEELAAALTSWRDAHPLAIPEHAGPDWPALVPEPPLENQVLDLLAWLTFWTLHALDHYHDQNDPKRPVIGNMDWQYHPLAR